MISEMKGKPLFLFVLYGLFPAPLIYSYNRVLDGSRATVGAVVSALGASASRRQVCVCWDGVGYTIEGFLTLLAG